VEALVEQAKERRRWPILWIAQTDELCEQAVQAWRSVWQSVGPDATSLVISRLWDSNRVDSEPYASCHVVVASIQALSRAVGNGRYEWLRNPGFVVVDEAHRSVAPSYRKTLEWLGIERTTGVVPLL